MADGEIRVQDEQGNIHVFPEGATPQMIAQALNVKAPGPSVNDTRAALRAAGGLPSGNQTPRNYIPDIPAPGTQRIPHPIDWAIEATPMLTGVESIPAAVTAARVAAGSYVGSKAAPAIVKGLGGGETAQNIAGVGGGLVGGFGAGTGLTRALFETPVKEALVKSGTADTMLDLLLHPRQTIGNAVKNWLQDAGATTETHPATHAAVQNILDSRVGAAGDPFGASAFAPKATAMPASTTGAAAPIAMPAPGESVDSMLARLNEHFKSQGVELPKPEEVFGPAQRQRSYLKAANGDPAKAALLQQQDESMAALLQQSIQQAEARAAK